MAYRNVVIYCVVKWQHIFFYEPTYAEFSRFAGGIA